MLMVNFWPRGSFSLTKISTNARQVDLLKGGNCKLLFPHIFFFSTSPHFCVCRVGSKIESSHLTQGCTINAVVLHARSIYDELVSKSLKFVSDCNIPIQSQCNYTDTRGPWTATLALIKVNDKNRQINKYFCRQKIFKTGASRASR